MARAGVQLRTGSVTPPSRPPAGNKTGALPASHPGWNSSDDKMQTRERTWLARGILGYSLKATPP